MTLANAILFGIILGQSALILLMQKRYVTTLDRYRVRVARLNRMIDIIGEVRL